MGTVAIALGVGLTCSQGRETVVTARQSEVPEVSVARPARRNVPIILNAVGAISPIASVSIRTQIDGTLTSVTFVNGQRVTAGQPLAEIDCREQREQWRQAQGTVEKDAALLANAKADFARYQRLSAAGAVAVQTFDNQKSLKEQYGGQLKADVAHRDELAVQLSYCKLVSPISGVIGLRTVDPGNLVHQTDADPIATITKMQPAKVVFQVPVGDAAQLRQSMHDGEVHVEFDSDTLPRTEAGIVQALDNQVDSATGTVKVEAILPNNDDMLFANQYGRVRATVRVMPAALLVPTTAIQRDDHQAFVYVIDVEKRVHPRPIVTGPADAGDTVVVHGLGPSDLVVVDGADRVRPGSAVVVVKDR